MGSRVPAVAAGQLLLQYPERNRRLGGGAGFGDHDDRNFLPAAGGQHFRKVGGRNVVADKPEIRGLFGDAVIQGGDKVFHRRPGPQIGTADANDQYRSALGGEPLRTGLEPGKLPGGIERSRVEPAEEIAARPAFPEQGFLCGKDFGGNLPAPGRRNHLIEVGKINGKCHRLFNSFLFVIILHESRSFFNLPAMKLL